MMGYSPEEIVGRSSSQMIMPDPLELVNLERQVRPEGEEILVRADARHKDGRVLPCDLRMFSLDSGSGPFLAFLTKRGTGASAR
jgi:PAS domain S-box-containing protein